MIAVLMPMTSPCAETSGPPELPGLSAASVWITSSINRPFFERKERPSAEMTPAVTLASKPKGLPIAIAISPGFSFFELPSLAAGRIAFSSMRTRAKSVSVVTEDAAGKNAPVERCHLGPFGALHDMAVGEDKTVRRENDTGARPTSSAAARRNSEPHDAQPNPPNCPCHRLRISIQKPMIALFCGNVGGRKIGIYFTAQASACLRFRHVSMNILIHAQNMGR